MPQQLKSAVMVTVALVAILFASNRAEENRAFGKFGANRGPASLRTKVPFRHTEKLHGPVEVTIDLIGPAPAAAGDVFVLKGIVSSETALHDVEYTWSLPPSVELINGRLSDRIPELGREHAVNLDLTLRARDANNAQIHLLASARSRGARFAEAAQYNTTRQADFAASRERLMKSTRALEAGAPADFKVFH